MVNSFSIDICLLFMQKSIFMPFSVLALICYSKFLSYSGQKFAITEEKAVLSWIFRRYKVETEEPFPGNRPIPELILKPSNGIRVRLTKRWRVDTLLCHNVSKPSAFLSWTFFIRMIYKQYCSLSRSLMMFHVFFLSFVLNSLLKLRLLLLLLKVECSDVLEQRATKVLLVALSMIKHCRGG